MRVCLVYDCLFPHTVGGAERWYRNLAERLAAEGHEVTFLTLRQWPRDTDPGLPGVAVVTAGPRMALYVAGRRRILPPLVFGGGVLWHLLRHGRRYDVVHTASFPYFSLLAAAVARPLGRFRLLVDWHEAWTLAYWRGYVGRTRGLVGWLVQRLCMAVPQEAFCFSRLHERRLHAEGFRNPITLLEGEYAGSLEPVEPIPAEPVVVFAGRHIPEKRVPALVRAMPLVRAQLPDVRCEIYGDGPERADARRLAADLGLDAVVTLPGFVDHTTVEAALRRALCLALPSRREGYGLVVVEASALGTPAVVVEDPDNASVELIDEGENGVVARSASPEDLAAAIVRVAEAGPGLRASTADWFRRNARRLSLQNALGTVVERYDGGPPRNTAA